ncbi:hypothetical protein PTKIN_Ptkin01aG0147500 [Pterospermum kingtungense]
MAKTESDSFDSNVKEGRIYTVSKFRAATLKRNFNAIYASLTITISRETKFTELYTADDQIPADYFEYAEFEDLHPRIRDNIVLIDVIGLVASVSKLTRVYIDDNP